MAIVNKPFLSINTTTANMNKAFRGKGIREGRGIGDRGREEGKM